MLWKNGADWDNLLRCQYLRLGVQLIGFNLQDYLDMLNAELVFRPYSRSTSIWEDMANNEFKAAWSGEATMEETFKEIAAQMNKTLAE